MNQSESKPVFYLKVISAVSGEYFMETYYTLWDLVYSMQDTKLNYSLVLMEATVIPANKQSWLDNILISQKLKEST